MTYLPVDVIVDQKAKQRHRLDALNLLAYVTLLVLVLVTTWFFKRRRRLYIHETGLAIIYGMLLGAALRYLGVEMSISSAMLEDPLPLSVPTDYVIVKARNLGDKLANKTHAYAYEFRGELESSAKLGSQISYATVDPEVFFNIILPPIVLNAGLSLKRRHFFRNIGAIFTYAFLGTTLSVLFVGGFLYGSIHMLKALAGYAYLADQFSLANCLYFGAIISPTDPLAVLAIFQELGVDVNLFALVFGESILNDAVSIVLTHSVDQFSVISARNPYYPLLLILWECVYNFINMFASSCLVGMLFGVASAITTKFTKLTESPLLETSLVVLMSYLSFLVAEVIDASGIVAILLCGITQAHYTINNLSFDARERLKNLFELLTFLCEQFLFLAVGVSFWQRGQTWNLTFIGLAFVAATLARAISIYPLTGLLNLGRRNRIPCAFQHVIAWGGAARGVISYSLAAKNTVGDARRIMLSTTSVIVIVSVILVGSFVDLMIKCLGIPTHADELPNGPYGDCSGNAGGGVGDGGNGSKSTQHNPNWLVRPKRLRHSSTCGSSVCCSAATTAATSHSQTPRRHRCGRAHARVSHTTPMFEVDAAKTADVMLRPQHDRAISTDTATLCMHDELECCGDNHDVHSQQSSQSQAHSDEAAAAAASASLTRDDVDVDDEASKAAQFHTSERAYENARLVRVWRNLDNNFIKPLLTNSQPTLMETMPPQLSWLARVFTSDEQLARECADVVVVDGA